MQRQRPRCCRATVLDSVALVLHGLGDITRHGESTIGQLRVVDIALLVGNFKSTSTRATLSVAFHFSTGESLFDLLFYTLEAGPVTSGRAVFDLFSR